MAMCEKCGKSGLDMRDMRVDQERKSFVGPCCIKIDPMAFDKDEVSYGVEFSSHMGVRAYASYGGLSIEFKKTKKEIQEWMEMRPMDLPPEEVSTQAPLDQTMN